MKKLNTFRVGKDLIDILEEDMKNIIEINEEQYKELTTKQGTGIYTIVKKSNLNTMVYYKQNEHTNLYVIRY